MKISGPEKGTIALTLAFLVLCVGYFIRTQGGSDSYTIGAQTVWTSEVGAAVTGDAQTAPIPTNAGAEESAGQGPAAAENAQISPAPMDAGTEGPAGEDPAGTDPVEVTPDGETAPKPNTAATGKININTATSEELQTLSGIGEVRAAAIIADREANGPFRIPEDITRVSGIGEGILAKIQDYITVG